MDTLSVKKNEWLDQFEACAFWDMKTVNSTCYYYEVFDFEKAFLDINNELKGTPRDGNSCD